MDEKEDETDSDLYMAPLAGGPAVRLTASKKPETSPRWSPDGRWLAFLSDREGKKTQVWLMSREGGEAVKLTDFKASVSSLAWSPDSTRLALVVADVDPDDPDAEDEDGKEKEKKKAPKPIVVRRLQFKRDYEGYLRDLRSHVHVFDVASKSSFALTSGAVRRRRSGLVARRPMDRLRQQPHEGPRRQPGLGHLRGRGARGGGAARAGHRPRHGPAAGSGAPTGPRSCTRRAAIRRTCGTGRTTWR